jgi:hypothetical protein
VIRSRRTKERRVSQRVPIAVPVFARGFDELGKEFLEFTATLNISGGGALVAMRRYLPPASSITLEIPAAPMPKLSAHPQTSRILQARIVRVTPSNPSYLWALSFSEPLN